VFSGGKGQLTEEKLHLGLAISGERLPRHWESEEAEADLYDLKGMVEELFVHLKLPFEMRPDDGAPFRKGRSFAVLTRDEKMGLLGEVSEEVLKVFGIKEKVFSAELDFGEMVAKAPQERQFSALPKFPPVDRDIAVVAQAELPSDTIVARIKEVGGGLIEEVTLFDVYQGKQVPPGKKSLAYSIRYRSREKTLTDEEVDDIHRKVILELEKKLGITLRK